MPAQKLDYKWTEQLLRRGMTQEQVIQEYAKKGVSVSQAAISMAISDGRIKAPANPKRQRGLTGVGIPWKLKPEHRHLHAARMLRSQARLEQGLPIGPSLQRQLESWIAGLMIEDAVIHYNADTEQGFWRVERRLGIDKWYVREPWIDDDGNHIDHPA